MEKAKRFEDLWVWQHARELVKDIYKDFGSGAGSKDFGFRDQVQRAGVSIMNNIAEGFERGSRREFHRFLSMANASCAQVRAQLYVALDVGYLQPAQFEQLLASTEELGRIIGGLRLAVADRAK